MKRLGTLLLGVLAACSTATSSGTTSSVSTPSTASTTTSPATTVPAVPADLMVEQILLRYDGQQEFGTLEVTVCNVGGAAGTPRDVGVTVNAVGFGLPTPGEIPAGDCADVFDPASDFASFGITAPGSFAVTAAVYTQDANDPPGNDTFSDTVSVDHVTTMNATQADFDGCLADGGTPEACTNLVYLFDPLADPHQIKKQRGPVVVIADAGYEALISWLVASSTQCGRYVEEYLGAPVPNPFSFHVSIVTDPAQELFGAARTDRINWRTDAATLDTWVGMLSDEWSDLLAGKCLTVHAHEITHLHVDLTPIPNWLNEGLATYLEGTPGGGQASTTLVGCEVDGWSENNVTHPFIQMAGPYDPNRVRDYYLTGACFWKYFEDTYGHDAFLQVIARLVGARDVAYGHCGSEFEATGFLRDFVQPVIGEDISALTQERFGFGADWNGCEG